MSEINDGGPAAPIHELNGNGQLELTHSGISFRDALAMAAMQALITVHHAQDIGFTITADDAYRMADAMIGARGTA